MSTQPPKKKISSHRLDARGRRTAIEMFGPRGARLMEAVYAKRERDTDASWADLSGAFVINGMYSRNVLSTAVRELCAVAALTVLGHETELLGHIRVALRNNPPRHVREVILQMSVYGGMPVAFEGLRLFDQVIAEPEFAAARKALVGKSRR